MANNEAVLSSDDTQLLKEPPKLDTVNICSPKTKVLPANWQLNTSFFSRILASLFTMAVLLSLLMGWLNQDESALNAEEGMGYFLGIIGGVLMLLLLLYPLRKKMQSMRRMGPIKYWFRTHMIFGVLGPVSVIFHTNFQLGSLNSNVALASMLLVACSGLVGRFFYKKIHFGLYGRKASLKELGQAALISMDQLSDTAQLTPKHKKMLQDFEKTAMEPHKGLLNSIYHVFKFALLTRWHQIMLYRFLKQALRAEAQNEHWNQKELRLHLKKSHRYLVEYFVIVRKVAELKFYERLFSWWHILHMPLFLMLILSGFTHVYAVHAY